MDETKATIHYINTGEVMAAAAPDVLTAEALGSCVAVVAYNTQKQVGAMAHVMLPGKCLGQNEKKPSKYADDAIDILLEKMETLGAAQQHTKICLVGGANLINGDNQRIGQDNLHSIRSKLRNLSVEIIAEAVGGECAKNVSLNIRERTVKYTENNSPLRELWKAPLPDKNNSDTDAGASESQLQTDIEIDSADMEQPLERNSEEIDRIQDLENSQRAYLNMMEDLREREKELEDSQTAYQNMIQDLTKTKTELEGAQQAQFNIMADLSTAQQETAKLNKDLENKVEERTRELRDSTVQLVQAEKLTALGELTAGVAHELKQPLNTIKIIGQSILRDIKKNRFDIETAEEDIPQVIKQVDKMSEIIDHMRIFSRKSDGMVFTLFNINEMVENSSKFFGQQLVSHGVKLDFNFGEDLPAIKGDPIRIEQVLLNLVNNARHAVEKNNKDEKLVLISTGCSEDKKTVHMELKDNGVGIPKNIQEKVFQPFFTTKDPDKGTGLGLSVSNKIIQEHKGKFELESTEGEGSLFRMSFPAADDF